MRSLMVLFQDVAVIVRSCFRHHCCRCHLADHPTEEAALDALEAMVVCLEHTPDFRAEVRTWAILHALAETGNGSRERAADLLNRLEIIIHDNLK